MCAHLALEDQASKNFTDKVYFLKPKISSNSTIEFLFYST